MTITKLLTRISEFFCRHDYQIGIISGIGFGGATLPASEKDGGEIICYCSKCGKRFITVDVRSNMSLHNVIKGNNLFEEYTNIKHQANKLAMENDHLQRRITFMTRPF